MQNKIQKIKIKPSMGQTHAPKYYLQLINYNQRGLDRHKTQKKKSLKKIKLSWGQTHAPSIFN